MPGLAGGVVPVVSANTWEQYLRLWLSNNMSTLLPTKTRSFHPSATPAVRSGASEGVGRVTKDTYPRND
jgi:hypothetical protein